MKKKRSTRLINAGDILITIVCLVGIAVALYLFWSDMNVSLSRQDETPVAVVYFKQNTVQRRLVDRNLWERVHESALVYDGDRIRTSKLSEAVTVFADGTEIEVHENTLIQIYKQKDRAAVDFISGAITATAAGYEDDKGETVPLIIKTGSKVVELNSGSAASVAAPVSSAVQTEKKDAVAVTVTKGTAAVREARLDDGYKEKTVATSIVSVAQNSIYDLGEIAVQAFAAVSSDSDETELLVAEEKQVLQTGEVSVIKTAESELPEDSDSVTTDQQESVSRSATLYLPVSSTTVQLEEGVMPLVKAQWESNADLLFEFSRGASFSEVLFSRTYASNQSQAYISLEDYTDGDTLFWRVCFADEPDSVFAFGVVLFQEVSDESAKEMADRLLNDQADVPLKEEPDTQEEAIKAEAVRKEEEERRAREEAARLDAQRAEEARLEAERQAAEQAAAEAEAARIEAERIEAERLAAEKAEAERIAAEKAEQERLEAERVAAARAAEERRLAAARAAEEKAATERAAREEAERRAREEAARLEAQRAEQAAAEQATREETERIAREEAERRAREESARLEAVRQAFASAKPTLREPSGGTVFDDAFFDTNRSLTFSWTPIADAVSYELVIKQAGTLFSRTVLDKNVSGTSFTMRTLSDLDEGEFEWTVTGKMADGTRSLAASSTFSVKLEPLESVELDTSDLFFR